VTESLPIEKFIQEAERIPVADVRTPAEFLHGHFPGASSLPLFENEERAMVGTLYAHAGSDAAILLGMDIVGPKLREYVQKGHLVAPRNELLLYCWRGGMRSSSLGWLLSTAGIHTRVLEGGYKAYRRYLHQSIGEPRRYIVIGGMTGCGKTDIIRSLAESGEQVLDLERLASHKGSAFGAIGEAEQPTQEQFENELFTAWKKLDKEKNIWIENESITIGRLYLPHDLFLRMQQAPLVELSLPFETRLERLIRDYVQTSNEALAEVFRSLERRIGGDRVKMAIRALEEKHYKEAARIALHYYDTVYQQQLTKNPDRIHVRYTLQDKYLINNIQSLKIISKELNF